MRLYALILTLLTSVNAFPAWENSFKLGIGGEHYLRESPVADTSGGVFTGDLSTTWTGGSYRFSLRGSGNYRNGVREESRRAGGDAQEFFLEYAPSSFTLQAGLNTVTWGVTDFYNPLDVVNSSRYDDFLSPSKRGAPMVRFEKGMGRWVLEGLWIPNQLETVLPSESSRWLPREGLPGRYIGGITTADNGTYVGFLSNDPVRYRYAPSVKWNDPLKNNFGFHLSGGFGVTDLQLVYHEGVNSAPQVRAGLVKVPDNAIVIGNPTVWVLGPELQLEPHFAKYRTVGASIAPTLGSFIFKGAYARSQAMDKNIDLQASHSWVSSLETTTNFWGIDWTFLLQNIQIYEERNASTAPFEVATVFSTNEILNQSYVVGMRLAKGLSWNLMAGAQLSTGSKGGVGQLSFEKRLTERMQAFLRTSYIDGATGSSLHQLRNASGASGGFNFSW